MYQAKIALYFKTKVKSRTFEVRDIVLRRLFPSSQKLGVGVLRPNWEGLYEIQKKVRKRRYHFKRLDGSKVLRAWNAEHLYHYY